MDHLQPHPELYGIPYLSDDFNGMPCRPVGRSGLRAANVGLGTWKFGFPETGDGARADEKTAFQIMDRAMELGMTFWDTANRYNNGSGNSERVIGRWLKANPDQRRNIVLATKIFGGMDGRTPNHCRLSRANILESVYACLARLQTDHLDLLYFHSYENATPAEESLEAIDDLVRRDLVRYFGTGGATLEQIRRYQAAAAKISNRCRPIVTENGFDLLHGEQPDRAGVLAAAPELGISFVAYSPLGRGLLTDRYLTPGKAGPGDRLFDEGTLEKDTAGLLPKLQQFAACARAWDLEVSQLALAYMLTLPGMGPVIPGSTTVKQLESNARAGKVALTAEQRAQIKAIVGY